MTVSVLQARKLQNLAEKYMCGKEDSYTDMVLWKESQQQLTDNISDLIKVKGSTAEEEAEVLLAVLMGYCVTMRNVQHVEEALYRAEEVLPRLKDKVLKCHLMVFCYNEFPDETLADEIYQLIGELKMEGKVEEIQLVENLLENIIDSRV